MRTLVAAVPPLVNAGLFGWLTWLLLRAVGRKPDQ